jgi:hypothetical protein
MADSETSAATAAAKPVATTSGSSAGTRAPMTIAQYSQMYTVSRNPFGPAAILPALVLAFLALEIGLIYNWSINELLGGFLIICTGLLLVPAVALRGSITFDDQGITFRNGKKSITATWNQVTGLTYDRDSGVCVSLKGQTQSQPVIRSAGGLRAAEGEAVIPIRYFGDRRFAILYEIRDRVPESAWREALSHAESPASKRPLIIYAGVVLLGIGSIVAVAINYFDYFWNK